jgi:hypothetical protein
MDAKNFFDYIGYFENLCRSNKLAQDLNFKFCTCSGIETLQGPLQQFRTAQAFFCVDDTNDGATIRGSNGGWFKKRTVTVFLLHRYNMKLMESYMAALDKCRALFRQLLTRMLVDEDALNNEMVYMRTQNVLSRELGQYFLNGCTGLYFMVEVAEPIDLTFDSDEWKN